MERATGIGGVFVRSAQPDRLRAWYVEHLGVELEDWGGTAFRSVGGETLVYAVDDVRDGRIDTTVGQVFDRDGNRFELWEPATGT